LSNWHDEADRLYDQYGDAEDRYAVIAKELQAKGLLIDRDYQSARGSVRSYFRNKFKINPTEETKTEISVDIHKPIGVFGDVHIPFDHPNYLQFVKDTFDKFGVSEVICLGDLVDHHAISRHQSETCAKGAYDELDEAIQRVAEYTKVFPNVRMCRGNHDDIPERQAATIGIGSRYLKEFSALFELPETWIIKNAFIVDGVLYKHGLNCLGKDGAINTAILERMSTVIGHSHAFGGVKYSANNRNIIFGLNAGCGIDIDAYAFAYGKHAKYRPTLGCGIVFNNSYATFIPMEDEYFRHSKGR
jgi:predicted phosphodiesterase